MTIKCVACGQSFDESNIKLGVCHRCKKFLEKPRKYTARPGTTINPLVKYPRNAECPCGSGKKFKKCCYKKIALFVPDSPEIQSCRNELVEKLKALKDRMNQNG